MNKRKILSLALALSMLAILAIGGTLAYFTDTDDDTNVFTMGNVSIEQYEHQLVDDKLVALDAGDSTKALKLMPVVFDGTGAYPTADDKFFVGQEGAYSSLDCSDSVAQADRWVTLWDEANVVDKMVSVFNDGDNDVYVRTIVAVPTSVNPHIVLNYVGGITWAASTGVTATINSTDYALYTFTYIRDGGILEPGKTTGPSLMQVLLESDTTSENVTAAADGFQILVSSQAVQADGFAETFPTDTAINALDKAFGAISADNHPWAE